MADLRIEVPVPEDTEYQRETDWHQDLRLWSASERELGAVKWSLHMIPTPEDISALRSFFHTSDDLETDAMMRLSPGELVYLHDRRGSPHRLLAILCETCEVHWTVYRLMDGVWRKHGHTSGFAWFRGVEASPDSDPQLAHALESENR